MAVEYAPFLRSTKCCVSGTDLRTSLAVWGLFWPYFSEKGVLGIFLTNKVVKNQSIFSAEVLTIFILNQKFAVSLRRGCISGLGWGVRSSSLIISYSAL